MKRRRCGTARTTTGSAPIDSLKYRGTPASLRTPNIGGAMEAIHLTLETATGGLDLG